MSKTIDPNQPRLTVSELIMFRDYYKKRIQESVAHNKATGDHLLLPSTIINMEDNIEFIESELEAVFEKNFFLEPTK